MKVAHFVLQRQEGCGKSALSYLLYNYLVDLGEDCHVINFDQEDCVFQKAIPSEDLAVSDDVRIVSKASGKKNIVVNFDAAKTEEFFEHVSLPRLARLYSETIKMELHLHIPVRDHCLEEDLKRASSIIEDVASVDQDVRPLLWLAYFDQYSIGKEKLLEDEAKKVGIGSYVFTFMSDQFGGLRSEALWRFYKERHKHIGLLRDVHMLEGDLVLNVFRKNFKNFAIFQTSGEATD